MDEVEEKAEGIKGSKRKKEMDVRRVRRAILYCGLKTNDVELRGRMNECNEE